MGKYEKIVAYLLMTYFLFGLIQFFISGFFIAPFLLNNSILVLVSAYFCWEARKNKPLTLVLFLIANLCFLAKDRLLLSTFFSDESIAIILGSNITQWLEIIGFVFYTFVLFYLSAKISHKTLMEKLFVFVLIANNLLFLFSWSIIDVMDIRFSLLMNAFLLLLWLRFSKKEVESGIYLTFLLFILLGLLELSSLVSFISVS